MNVTRVFISDNHFIHQSHPPPPTHMSDFLKLGASRGKADRLNKCVLCEFAILCGVGDDDRLM